ncbi:YcbX family protein [Thalassotalea marina]|uniref:(2Fe-2S)-binding protein n=1 Tax=Thalassotalea marina TaxID=1673741 RepID=A0A919EP89_9GAMM|nr:YcbX family protein [Thalassotalea marina]GHG05583.1 (2Fe-2S)-binding protein [Thalassotalea marina]
MSSAFVQSVHVYPIKSASGISLSHSWVDDFGLSFDRRFVVTELNGRFITARTQPSLCLISVNITPEGLVLTAPDMPVLEIKFKQFSEQYHAVTVWNDEVNALYCHQHYDKWFSDYLGLPCQLHFFAERSSRYVKNRNNQVAFADGYPLLLATQATLDDLNKKLKNHQVTMNNFRPNVVVGQTLAFAEDTWKHIRIGEVEFEITKPCSRCIFTTVDPLTGEKHPKQEPLATLKQYRQLDNGDVIFGQNMVALNKGIIRQGDEVTIISEQSAPNYTKPSKKTAEASIESVKTSTNMQAELPEMPKKSSVNLSFASWNTQHKGNTKEPILDQGEAAGLILPYSCRGGMCGRCKIKLESGEVRQLADDGLTDEEKAQGYVLACSAIPQSDLVLTSGK